MLDNLVIRFPTLNLEPEGGALGEVNLPGCPGSAFGGGFAFGGLGGRVVTKSACSVCCSGTVVFGDSKLNPWKPGKVSWLVRLGEPTGLTLIDPWFCLWDSNWGVADGPTGAGVGRAGKDWKEVEPGLVAIGDGEVRIRFWSSCSRPKETNLTCCGSGV